MGRHVKEKEEEESHEQSENFQVKKKTMKK